MQQYRHFKVVVAGENPEELMAKYDAAFKVEPYVIFEYAKAEEYKQGYLSSLKALLRGGDDADIEKMTPYLKEEIKEVEKESANDYFAAISMGYEIDPETGNALSRENPNEKFTSHKIGGDFSLPFILKGQQVETEGVYSARKEDIDWDKIHMANKRPYEVAWDTTHGLATPQNDEERTIYDHMKNLNAYFLNFEGREHYIASNTAFWALAFVDKNGWNELSPKEKQFDWVINFYDRFIKPLPGNTLLTIYECVRYA